MISDCPILNCVPEHVVKNYIYVNRNTKNVKAVINKYIGEECEDCFIDALFTGVLTKNKNSLIIFRLPDNYKRKDTKWIVSFFEESWLKIYYSDNMELRNKILSSDPEIFIIRKNRRFFCVLNFNES
jgi:hypothetical protein